MLEVCLHGWQRVGDGDEEEAHCGLAAGVMLTVSWQAQRGVNSVVSQLHFSAARHNSDSCAPVFVTPPAFGWHGTCSI